MFIQSYIVQEIAAPWFLENGIKAVINVPVTYSQWSEQIALREKT